MLRRFISLEWKRFLRSPAMKMNLVIKIIMGLGAVFYSFLVLALGVAAFYGLQEELDLEPLSTINTYLIYWWGFDLVSSYFGQKPPVMRVKPLLTLPIKKKKLTHYLLGRSAFSFFNIYPFFFFVPFSITLLYNGYSPIGVVAWHLALFSITYFNSFLNLMINNRDGVFIGVALVLVGLVGLHYFEYFDITQYAQPIFQGFYEHPWTAIIPMLLLVAAYIWNYRYYRISLYLDKAVQFISKRTTISEYSWLNRFGLMGTFLKNDLRLILRNKRALNTLWMSLFFLFYGIIISIDPSKNDSSTWLIFAGIFIPGGFLFTFGGYVPSWDSAHYPLMMSQNIKYKEYLTSKWWLMVVATLLSMIVSIFYLWIEPKFYLAILAGGIYNIGFNAHIVLLSGAYVKTPIDLSSGKKPFGDKGNFNIKTILLTLPKIVLPLLIFYLFQLLFDFNTGLLAVAGFGLVGLLFRNRVFKMIEKIYKKEKYDTLAAYRQKN